MQRAAIAAGRLHISLQEFLAHKESGQIWCGIAKHWVSAEQANKTLHTCRSCKTDRIMASYRLNGRRSRSSGEILVPAASRDEARARRLGVSLDDYLAHQAAGDRWCSSCQAFRSAEHFYQTRTSRCRSCETDYKRQRYRAKDGDRVVGVFPSQASAAVHAGLSLEAYQERRARGERRCAHCGVWRAAEMHGSGNWCRDCDRIRKRQAYLAKKSG